MAQNYGYFSKTKQIQKQQLYSLEKKQKEKKSLTPTVTQTKTKTKNKTKAKSKETTQSSSSSSEERLLFESLSNREAQFLLAPQVGGETWDISAEEGCLNSLKSFLSALVEVFSHVASPTRKGVEAGRTLIDTQQWKGVSLRTYGEWLNAIEQLLDESGIVDYPVPVSENVKTLESLSSSSSLRVFPPSKEKKKCNIEVKLASDLADYLYSIFYISRDKINLPKFVKMLSDFNKSSYEMLPNEIEESVHILTTLKARTLWYWRKELDPILKRSEKIELNLGVMFAFEIWKLYVALVRTHEEVLQHVKRVVFRVRNRDYQKELFLKEIDETCQQYKSAETCPTDKCKYGSYWIFWKRCSALKSIPLLGDSAIETIIRTAEKQRISPESVNKYFNIEDKLMWGLPKDTPGYHSIKSRAPPSLTEVTE